MTLTADNATTSRLRPVVFGLLVLVVLLWPKASPPDLSGHNIKQVSGRYVCQQWPIEMRGRVDGVRYANDFGFVFGYGNVGMCFRELNGRMVLIRFVETPSPNPPLMLSLRDSETGSVWGAGEADRLQRMRVYLGQTWWFSVSQGVAILVLALLFYPHPFQRGLAAIGRITRLSH